MIIDEKFMDKNKWPPRQTDFNPCDFLQGYLKSKFYIPHQKTLEDLKQIMRNDIETIKRPLLESTFITKSNFAV